MRMRLSRVGGFRSEEIAAWARCHLEPGTVVVSDALGCFGAVRQAGCFHQPFVTGSGPASAQHPALTWVNTILGNIKRCQGRREIRPKGGAKHCHPGCAREAV